VSALVLRVNGETVEVVAGSTIADLVARLTAEAEAEAGAEAGAKGVAVAVDRCVIPRSEWATTPARAGSLVEVVTAAAGG
jgi:sulfur carrier protein